MNPNKRLDQIDQLRTDMNNRFKQVDERFEQVNSRFDQLAKALRQEMQEGFHTMNRKFTLVSQTQEQILTLLLDRLK